MTLKKTIEEKITKGNNLNSKIVTCYRVSFQLMNITMPFTVSETDGVIGIGIAATAVGVLVGGIAAALARKN